MFFRKKPADNTPKRPRSSFFSSDVPVPFDPDEIDRAGILVGSFQRTVSDGTPRDREGKATMDSKPAPVTAMDGFAMDAPSAGNPLSMKPLIEPLNPIPFFQLVWYANQGFIGYQICAMLAQHWLVDKICTIPCRDAMRHGYEVTINEGVKKGGAEESEVEAESEGDDQTTEIIAFINKRDKQLGIKQNCVEFVRFNRIFGIRIALPIIETDDLEYYEKPFNADGVKPGSYKGISQVDPYWITPELDFEAAANPASMHFYEPTWWRVNGKRIHRTHLVIIRNGQVADILKPSYLYGGVSVPQKVYERVYGAERTANEAPQLALSKRLLIVKTDTDKIVAEPQLFAQKMAFLNQNKDNFGTYSIGLDDTAEQTDTTLTDLDSVIMGQYTIACAAGECPVTKVMGTSPKGGLGSEGEYDADSYHEFLETLQMNDMQPLLERHHLLLMKSEVEPKFNVKFTIDVSWNPVDTPSAEEQATINKTKADTDAQLVTVGAIDGTDVRQRLIADKDSGYNGIAPIVPSGPGDRDAEQERRDMELESQNEPDSDSD